MPPLHYLQELFDAYDDALESTMDEPERLRYRSNLLGSDKRLTNFGGGNTSAKVMMADPLTGADTTVLWVKGSGGDLGTITRDGFATLYQEKLESLKSRYRGVAHEDEMVELLTLCAFAGGGKAPSIDTPLHAFLPFAHVDHLHPDWAIALAASANGMAHLDALRAETGIHLVWIDWKRPGWELGLWLEKAAAENPKCDGIILGSHGLFTWGDTSRTCFNNTLRVLDAVGTYLLPKIEAQGDALFGGAVVETRADASELVRELMPVLRGQINSGNIIGHFSDDSGVLRFVNSANVQRLSWAGTSCPDHFVRTKVRPMLVGWDAANGDAASLVSAARATFPAYREGYAAYYDENKEADSPVMRAPEPTVVLVPGVGLFSFGKTKAEARITAEFYTNAIHVMEGATALAGLPEMNGIESARVVDNYVSLPPREAFRIEYWALEEAKLRRMPAEKELSRKIALIVGAGPGIGTQIALRLAGEGACVVCADLRPENAHGAAQSVQAKYGKESATHVSADCTDRDSMKSALSQAVCDFGGVDTVVVVAAVFVAPDSTGRVTEAQWKKTFDVNVLGSYVACDEAIQTMHAQGTGGSVVLITSANAVVAKKGSFAYDTSKAAAAHLVREMAVEGGTYGVRVNAVAPASVVEGSLMFPRDRVLTSLSKYAIPHDESEDDDTLRGKLAQFYAERTLLKRKVTPAGVAEAVFLLASEKRTGLMTGQTLAVDAGLADAFLR